VVKVIGARLRRRGIFKDLGWGGLNISGICSVIVSACCMVSYESLYIVYVEAVYESRWVTFRQRSMGSRTSVVV